MCFFDDQVMDVLRAGFPQSPQGEAEPLWISITSDMSQSFASPVESTADELPTYSPGPDPVDSLLQEISFETALSQETKPAPVRTTTVPLTELLPMPTTKGGQKQVKSRKRTTLRPIPEPKQFKNWKNATPSKYCHGCGGVPRGPKAVCKHIAEGKCRKMFCGSCIEKIYGGWTQDLLTQNWECTHCAGACPVKASCHYYSKRNSQRHTKGVRSPR